LNSEINPFDAPLLAPGLRTTPLWNKVTANRPDIHDFPVLVVSSRWRNKEIWAPLSALYAVQGAKWRNVEDIWGDMEDIKKDVCIFFLQGEIVHAYELHAPPC